MADPTLDSIAAQLSAISLKLDEDREERRQQAERITSLELVVAAVLQALTRQQMPMLGTMDEKLDLILKAAGDEKSGGELAQAIRDLARQVAEGNEQTMRLTQAVDALPDVFEHIVLVAGHAIDLQPRPGPEGGDALNGGDADTGEEPA